jgi:hypothetical protein
MVGDEMVADESVADGGIQFEIGRCGGILAADLYILAEGFCEKWAPKWCLCGGMCGDREYSHVWDGNDVTRILDLFWIHDFKDELASGE